MKKEKLEEIIEGIILTDGPDGHLDGSDIIIDFILSLLAGNGMKWWVEYNKIDRTIYRYKSNEIIGKYTKKRNK